MYIAHITELLCHRVNEESIFVVSHFRRTGEVPRKVFHASSWFFRNISWHYQTLISCPLTKIFEDINENVNVRKCEIHKNAFLTLTHSLIYMSSNVPSNLNVVIQTCFFYSASNTETSQSYLYLTAQPLLSESPLSKISNWYLEFTIPLYPLYKWTSIFSFNP